MEENIRSFDYNTARAVMVRKLDEQTIFTRHLILLVLCHI